MHPDTAAPAPATGAQDPALARPRITGLDVLRGLALCGILLVNIAPVTHFRYGIDHPPATLDDPSGWLQLFVQQRFFPVFSLLFGIGFALFLNSAAERTPRPRVLLLRRLLVLLPVGVLHQLWHPGEALAFYAVLGVLVLLPFSWLPRWATAAGAAVLIPASLALTGGGLTLIPGMFLLGSALVRYGLIATARVSTRAVGGLFIACLVAAVPATLWQLGELANSGFNTSSGVAGLFLAGAYVTGVVLLLATPARPVLHAVFSPLGRMALTNYLSATPVMVLIGHTLDFPHSRSWTQLLLAAALILLAQWIFSTLWLRRYTQGPLEWLWRWATWGHRPPLRRHHQGRRSSE